MRWKAFFQSIFDWHRSRLSKFLEFPLESLIFSIGVVAVLILISWIAGGIGEICDLLEVLATVLTEVNAILDEQSPNVTGN